MHSHPRQVFGRCFIQARLTSVTSELNTRISPPRHHGQVWICREAPRHVLNEEPQFLLSVAHLALRELRSSSGASVSGPRKREEAGDGGLSEAMGGGGAAHIPLVQLQPSTHP